MKKWHITTKKLCYVALMTAIAAVFNIFTILTSNRYFAISFTYVPCFLAGAFLGPVSGFLVGFLGDVLGAIISPKGAYMPLIGIASGCLGLIPGLVFRFLKIKPYLKIIVSFALCAVICTAFLNTLGVYILIASKKTFWAFLIVRLPFQLAVAAINLAIVLVIYKPISIALFKLKIIPKLA